MNYLLDKKTVFASSKNKKNGPNFFLVLVLVVFLFVFGSVLFPPLSQPLVTLANPLFSSNLETVRGLKNVISFFESKKSLLRQNESLRQELRLAKSDLFLAQVDLNRLSDLIDLPRSEFAPERYSLGEVIARPRFLPYDVLLLSVNTGATGNQPALGSQITWRGDILLGEIVQVAGQTAKVKLYSSAGVKRRVFVGEEKIQAVMEGRGGGNFIITLPRGVEINKNDRVYWSSSPNFVLGLVGEVAKSPENPFQTIYVKAPVNIYTLEWVEINAL